MALTAFRCDRPFNHCHRRLVFLDPRIVLCGGLRNARQIHVVFQVGELYQSHNWIECRTPNKLFVGFLCAIDSLFRKSANSFDHFRWGPSLPKQ